MENMLGSLLCLPGSGSVLLDPYGSTISETTSEAWSVEVLPSDSGGLTVQLLDLSPLQKRTQFILHAGDVLSSFCRLGC